MGRFITPSSHAGVASPTQQEVAQLPVQPKLSHDELRDNRPLNALPAVALPNNAALEELEQPLLPRQSSSDRPIVAVGTGSSIPDVEPVMPLDQSPLHLQDQTPPAERQEGQDPFADIYEDFKERELSPEAVGYVPLKGNETASPVRLGGYTAEPSPLTAMGITRPAPRADTANATELYEIVPEMRPDINSAAERPGGSEWALAVLGDTGATNTMIGADASLGKSVVDRTMKRRFLRRHEGQLASSARSNSLPMQRRQKARNYDPFAAVDAALAELGPGGAEQASHALVRRPATGPQLSSEPTRHWGSETAIVAQPDIDQAPRFKKQFANISSRVDRKQRCFAWGLRTPKLEMPDFTFQDASPKVDTGRPQFRATNSKRPTQFAAPESDAARAIDDLLMSRKPLRHWGYEPALVCQPDIDQKPNYKRNFVRRASNVKCTAKAGFHRGGVAWFIPMGDGMLRTGGGAAWLVDMTAAEESHGTACRALVPVPDVGERQLAIAAPLPPAEATIPAASAAGVDDAEEPAYWHRTDSSVTSNNNNSSLNNTSSGEHVKQKKGNKLKRLASKLFGGKSHKSHDVAVETQSVPFAANNGAAPRAVRTSAYPLGLPVAPCVEKKRIKELKRHGIAVPPVQPGDPRTDPAFVGPRVVDCAAMPVSPVPAGPATAHTTLVAPLPAESPATAAVCADPAVFAVGPKVGDGATLTQTISG